MFFGNSVPPPLEDVLLRCGWVAGAATARRHTHLDLADRAYLHHLSGEPAAVPRTVSTDRHAVAARTRTHGPTPRRPRPDDAQTPPHPNRNPREAHRGRTQQTATLLASSALTCLAGNLARCASFVYGGLRGRNTRTSGAQEARHP